MKTLRTVIPLVVGLLIGVVGAVLFVQSMPPPEGSAEEKVVELEAELKRVENRLVAFEAKDPHGRRKPGRTLKDGARGIAENFRDGKPVTPDDVFRAAQPFIRDFAPIFERMRTKELQRQSDTMAGQMARKYSLNASQQEALKKWLDQKAEDESKRYFNMVSQEGISQKDLAAAANDIRLDDGLEQFMANTLSAEKMAAFKNDRMAEKVERVQQEADMKVERLNAIVGLNETQRGQIFGVMARGAKDFDPGMSFEGLGTDTAPLARGGSRQDAIIGLLTPEQRAAFTEDQQRRRDSAAKELGELGLSLPENWDPLEEGDF